MRTYLAIIMSEFVCIFKILQDLIQLYLRNYILVFNHDFPEFASFKI